MERVKLHDKEFELFITREQISEAVKSIADRMNVELKGKDPVFIVVLGGAFLFAADLLRELEFNCEVSFIRVASYEGTSSTGKVKEIIGLNQDISGRDIVLVEDIVDTGHTLEALYAQLSAHKPSSMQVATFLYKPEAYQGNQKVEYRGMEVPNDFVVGYGLDYDGVGRNLSQIYRLSTP